MIGPSPARHLQHRGFHYELDASGNLLAACCSRIDSGFEPPETECRMAAGIAMFSEGANTRQACNIPRNSELAEIAGHCDRLIAFVSGVASPVIGAQIVIASLLSANQRPQQRMPQTFNRFSESLDITYEALQMMR